MAGASHSDPVLVDIRYGSQGKDGLITVTVSNRGKQKESVTLEDFELNGLEPTTSLPMKISLNTGEERTVKLVFPGQSGAGYNQSGFSYFANGIRNHTDSAARPNLMFITESGATLLHYDSDFANRPLEVQILSISSEGKNLTLPQGILTIPVGQSIPFPGSLSRPATVRYQVRLKGNRIWKADTIYLDLVSTDRLSPSS